MSIDPKNILEIHSFALLAYPVGKGHNDQIARRPTEPRGKKNKTIFSEKHHDAK